MELADEFLVVALDLGSRPGGDLPGHHHKNLAVFPLGGRARQLQVIPQKANILPMFLISPGMGSQLPPLHQRLLMC